MSILAEMKAQVKQGATVAQAIEEIVPGADPIYWEFVLAGGKRQSRTNGSRTNGNPKAGVNYAERVLVWKLGSTCSVCGSEAVIRYEDYWWCTECGHYWKDGEMTTAETDAAQAAFDAAHPAEDYSLGLG